MILVNDIKIPEESVEAATSTGGTLAQSLRRRIDDGEEVRIFLATTGDVEWIFCCKFSAEIMFLPYRLQSIKLGSDERVWMKLSQYNMRNCNINLSHWYYFTLLFRSSVPI